MKISRVGKSPVRSSRSWNDLTSYLLEGLQYCGERAAEDLEIDYGFIFDSKSVDKSTGELSFTYALPRDTEEGADSIKYYVDDTINPDLYDYINSGDYATAIEMLKSEMLSKYVEDYGPIEPVSSATSSTNVSSIPEKLEKIEGDDINAAFWDDEDDESSDYVELKTKSVRDSDGFMTEYTMYYDSVNDRFVFVFGDRDLYRPEDEDFDFETESDEEAEEWFDSYTGFEDEEDIVEECSDINASMRTDNPVEWVDATFVVRKMYNKFPDFEFIDERDMGENVALYFKLGPDVPGVEEFLSKLGIDYRISNGKLRIVVPEDQDYEEPGEYEEWGDSPVDECQSITSSSEVDLKPFVVRYGWDDGGPESGPHYGYGEDIVYAISKEDACSKWESENQEQIEGLNSGKYGGYEGCFARPATEDDLRELEEEEAYWAEMEKHFMFDNGDVYPIDECKSIQSSKEFFDKGDGLEYWYFTTHGVMPGSVPRGLEILDVVDKPEGSYFKTNKVLTTDALKYYDIKERVPKGVTSSKDIKAWYTGDPDPTGEYEGRARYRMNKDIDYDALYEIAERYNTSSPVSGDWRTETEHELNAIADELDIPKSRAKRLMIDELGFSEADF